MLNQAANDNLNPEKYAELSDHLIKHVGEKEALSLTLALLGKTIPSIPVTRQCSRTALLHQQPYGSSPHNNNTYSNNGQNSTNHGTNNNVELFPSANNLPPPASASNITNAFNPPNSSPVNYTFLSTNSTPSSPNSNYETLQPLVYNIASRNENNHSSHQQGQRREQPPRLQQHHQPQSKPQVHSQSPNQPQSAGNFHESYYNNLYLNPNINAPSPRNSRNLGSPI